MTAPAETRSGGCLCGAVRFSARLREASVGACHCETCRRWTGSALLSVAVPRGDLTWSGEDRIATRQTSAWASRSWCRDCGSTLFFQVTAPGPESERTWLALGLFDDPDGLQLASEIYIDQKPDGFAYAGTGRQLMTRQQCIDAYAPVNATQPDRGDSHDQD